VKPVKRESSTPNIADVSRPTEPLRAGGAAAVSANGRLGDGLLAAGRPCSSQ